MRAYATYPALTVALLMAAVFAQPPDALAQLALPDIPDKTCTLGTDASKSCEYTLPRATGAQGIVNYKLGHQIFRTEAPYTVYSFNENTRKLTVHAKPSGQAKNGWPFVLAATDEDPASEVGAIFGTASTTFTVTFDGYPAVTLPAGDLNFTVGETVNERLQTSGNGDLTVSATVEGWNAPSKPATAEFDTVPGLAFAIDDNNRAGSTTPHLAYTTISGTPTQPGEYDVTLKITDGDGHATTSSTFKIFVNAVPSFGGAQVPNTVFAIGEEGTITLPEVTLGNGAWEHHTRAWDPALPPWLTFDNAGPAALKLRGTAPGSDVDARMYTLTVTDNPIGSQTSGDSATLSLCFSVGDGTPCGLSFEAVTVADQTYTKGRRIEPLTLPEARQGTGAVTYTLSGRPRGLVFDPGTRRLSGTPGEIIDSPRTVTYTATDAADASLSLEFKITVIGPLSFGGEAPGGFDFTEGRPVNVDPLPAAEGGSGTKTYTVSGLPPGLEFDLASLTLSGTPEKAATFKLVLKATDENGAGASLSIPVRVHPPVKFPESNVLLGFPGPADTLEPAQGGFGPLTYTLACAATPPPGYVSCTGLPPGITFEKETRTVSGDFAASGRYDLDLTATDRNGATDTLHIDLRVAGIIVKAYANQAAQDAGNAFPGLTIPVPEASISAPFGPDDVPRYTLNLAVAPPVGDEITITLKGPSGDPDLEYFHGPKSLTPQTTKFTYASNTFDHEHTILLFAADDTDGLNGTATIKHTVSVNKPEDPYNGITFDVTLMEVDNDPSVELSLAPASLAENAGESSVTLTATVEPPAGQTTPTSFSEATTIALGWTGGTATRADYSADLPRELTIPANATSGTATFTFTPNDDDLYDPDETVVVTGTVTESGTKWSTGSATLTITDNDKPLVADCGERIVREGGDGQTTHVICTVTLRDANGNPVTADEDTRFSYRTVPDTATPGEDYEHSEGQVTIKKGQSSASFVIAVYDDDEKEDPERFNVEFSASPPFADLVITINDDDGGAQAQPPRQRQASTDTYSGTVAFGATAYTVAEGGEAATTIAVTLAPAPPEALTLSIPIAGNGGPGVTPDDWRLAVDEAGGDAWDAATGTATLVFAAGETERALALEAIDDADVEDTETLTLTFDADRLPGGVRVDPEAAETVVTIVDNDTATVAFDATAYTAAEGGEAATVAVKLDRAAAIPLSIPIAASAGQGVTAEDWRIAGEPGDGESWDEASGTIVLHFGPGQTERTLSLTAQDDEDIEGNETLTLAFDAERLPAVVVTVDPEAPAVVTLADNDTATVAFDATAYTVTEGGEAATVAVKLDRAAAIPLSIPIAASAGQGVTAEDWRIAGEPGDGESWDEASGTIVLHFGPGQTERTLSLVAQDDEEVEGDETLTLAFDAERLPSAVVVDPVAATAEVTLVDNDLKDHRGRVLKHVLAAFGRTVATDAVELLAGRMADDAVDRGGRVTLGGRTFDLRSLSGSTEPAGNGLRDGATLAPGPSELRGPPVNAGQSISMRQLLAGSSFRYRHGDPEDGLLTLWGQGGATRFEGGSGTEFSLDGEAASGWLGMDWRRKDVVAGLSVSHYQGDVGYDFAGNSEIGGDVDLELTSLFPYARLSPADGLDLWGIAGIGKGNLTLTDGFGGNRTDITMQMAAAGLRRAMKPVGARGFNFAAKADGFLVRIASEARGLDSLPSGDDLPSVDASARRLRLALEAGYTHALTSGAVLQPTAEVGARYDGGDAETGTGLDLAGGLRYQSPSRRLLVEGRGRVLLVHAATGFREWAASGLVRLTPEAGGQGLSFSLQPAWGPAQAGPGALWDAALPDAATTSQGRVTAEVGYGLALRNTGLVTPYAGTVLADGANRTYRLGARWQGTRGLTLNVEGTRQEPAGAQPLNQGLRFELSWGF